MKIVLAFLLMFSFVLPVLSQTGGQESPGGNGEGEPTPVSQIIDPTPTSDAPAPAPQVRATPIRMDTPLTVTLEGTTPVTLSFKAVGGETISVSARSLAGEDVLDPALSILDASGAEIADNDDHRTSRTDLSPSDSLISSLVLPAAGQYTIILTSGTGDSGDVEVILATGSPEPAQANQTINDIVNDNQTFSYDFTANGGDMLTITVRETDGVLDPTVTLLDSTGTELASNDDQVTDSSLGPYDSQIADVAIPTTGTYTVEITGYQGVGGSFELTINQSGGGEVTPPTEEPPATPQPNVNTTEVVNGTVNSNDVYSYSMDMEAGDVYTITVVATSDDLDPLISIYMGDDFVIDNDDYGSTDLDLAVTDARIYHWIIPDTGSYEFDISGYGDSAGDFEMTIERVATGASLDLPDEQVELASVESGNTFTYTFEAEAGDYVTITARVLTRDADPYIMLMDADETVLIDNDNTGTSNPDLGFYDSQIPNFIITESGTYIVEVSDVNGTPATYGLTVGILR